MILIADSGSTKTEWALIKSEKNVDKFKTIGLNPVFVNSETIIKEIKSTQIINNCENIKEIYFYGAGCSSVKKNIIIETPLKQIFPNAKIVIQNDLVGAGISQFKNDKGIIGILGTGSNTGIYKNGRIVENINSLGYILGDEGSGAVIGKKIIKLYLNKELPENITKKFNIKFNISLNDIIAKVYKEPFPNKFLASFMPFVLENKDNDFIRDVLYNSFSDFFDKTICKYNNYLNYEFKLIGSIAFYFEEIIRDICLSRNINLTTISKSPMQGLINFYIKKID